MTKKISEQTEQELRDSKVPWPKTKKELIAYIDELVNRQHDYGTCVYAMSMAATAAFYYVSGQLGPTGFQASCADMDIIKRTRSMNSGFRIIDYDKLLYPQYLNSEHFPDIEKLISDNREHLRKIAKEKLEEAIKEDGTFSVHPNVIAHWKKLASDEYFTMKEDDKPEEDDNTSSVRNCQGKDF